MWPIDSRNQLYSTNMYIDIDLELVVCLFIDEDFDHTIGLSSPRSSTSSYSTLHDTTCSTVVTAAAPPRGMNGVEGVTSAGESVAVSASKRLQFDDDCRDSDRVTPHDVDAACDGDDEGEDDDVMASGLDDSAHMALQLSQVGTLIGTDGTDNCQVLRYSTLGVAAVVHLWSILCRSGSLS